MYTIPETQAGDTIFDISCHNRPNKDGIFSDNLGNIFVSFP